MRILICDDDAIIRSMLEKYIKEYFTLYKLVIPEFALYENGTSLLNDNNVCDFLFIDIEMPDINGICAGQNFKEKYPHALVFVVTAYPQYLDDAMRIDVFRYLSKPVDKQRLFQNLTDGLRQYHSRNTKISIESKNEVADVYLKDIIMVERLGRKVLVYTQNGIMESIHSLAFWIHKLDHPCFFQTHRSYIINMDYISHYNKETIHLDNGNYQAYLSTRKYTLFRKTHIAYIESVR